MGEVDPSTLRVGLWNPKSGNLIMLKSEFKDGVIKAHAPRFGYFAVIGRAAVKERVKKE